jgi:uncharacterized membrane protein YesL
MFRRALRVAWFAIRVTYDEFFALSGMGFLWFLMAVVLPYGVFLLTASFSPWPALSIALTAISLILLPPATAALFNAAWYLAHEKRLEFAYFWQGFKEYFGSSWKVSGIMLVALLVLVADLYFFFQSQGTLMAILGFVMLWVILVWIAIQIYLYPLLIALEEKKVGQIFKNAAQLTGAFPLFSLLMLVAALLGTALSVVTFVPIATVWMPFIAILFSRAFVSSWDEALSIQQRHRGAETKEGNDESHRS